MPLPLYKFQKKKIKKKITMKLDKHKLKNECEKKIISNLKKQNGDEFKFLKYKIN